MKIDKNKAIICLFLGVVLYFFSSFEDLKKLYTTTLQSLINYYSSQNY